jgi:hypothetical protein
VSDLFEYIFGIRQNVPQKKLVIDVRLTDEYGIDKYPFGPTGLLDIRCDKRAATTEKPHLTIRSNQSLTIIVKWQAGQLERTIAPGKTTI